LVWFEMDIYCAYVGQFQSGQVVKFDLLLDALPPGDRRADAPLVHPGAGQREQPCARFARRVAVRSYLFMRYGIVGR
jgi:hypothetical protein